MARVAPLARPTWPVALLAALAVLVPVAYGALVATRRPVWPLATTAPVRTFPPWPGPPLERVDLGPPGRYLPSITHVRIVDLDGDGRADVLASDARRHRVLWYRQQADGSFMEDPLGDELPCPAVFDVADLTGDGRLDVVVAVLGQVFPSDQRIGQIVLLERRGDTVERRVLLDDLRRVADVQAGDLDGDGDTDVVAAVFGYHHGQLVWLENLGDGRFADHLLLATDGPSHARIADLDGDGRPEIVALVSQDHEEVWGFSRGESGTFVPRLLHAFPNFDLGATGLVVADLDGDGRDDLLVAAGDNLEIGGHFPQPWHGCIWLRNRGDGSFDERRLPHVGGVYAAAVGDLAGDGRRDVAVASMFNDWRRSDSASLVILRNDGAGGFLPAALGAAPVSLATIAVGDVDGDGRDDIVTGALNLTEPPDARGGRLSLWRSGAGGAR